MPNRKPTILATGWGATTMQLSHDRKSILVRTPKNPVFGLVDAQCLADGILRLIREASSRGAKNTGRTARM